jgi:hypothetical protein
MYGVTESPHGPIICGSCVLSPLPSSEEEDLGKTVDVKMDLTYLDDKKKTRQPKGRNFMQVQMDLNKIAMKQPIPIPEVLVKRLKLKSNSLRDRAYLIEGMVLHFDGDGIATFPEHCLEAILRHTRVRPGRFRLLEETPKLKKSPAQALDDARAALEAARMKQAEPEPKPEPKPEPELEPESKQLELEPVLKDEPKEKKRSRARRKLTRKSSKKKSEEF